MSDQNIQGVDIGVGKVSLPLTLASVTGPNNFGDSLILQYATLGLLSQIRTWNEETHTDVVGLGWCLSEEYIMRVGNGSLDDQFIWSQDSAQALVLKSKTCDSNTGIYTLEFVTVTKNLTQITYQTIPNDVNSPEIWTIIDANGVTYTYGGNQAAIDWGVRWVATDGVSPLNWIGSSTSTENQVNYALMWRIASKENIYGQRVEYDYFSVKYNVGQNGQGLSYTMASYLQGIRVANGGSITLCYADKETWEYPALRMLLNTADTGSYGVTNAYQDRVVTKYLQAVNVYNSEGNLQSVITLGYDFLFMHYPGLTSGNNLNAMQKRVLTAVNYFSASGQSQKPSQLFDYWGLTDGTDSNYSTPFTLTDSNLLILTNANLTAAYTYIDNYQQTHHFGALYGHLKTTTSPHGSVTWYSYREVSANYAQVSWPAQNTQGQSYDWDTNWKNQLDLNGIPWPASENGNWQNPRPFWGADNYVVVVWDSVDNNEITLSIFEWMGYWKQAYVVQGGIGVGTTFSVDSSFRDYGDECIKFGMGSGKFALCRLGISAADAEMGLIVLFNRDPYLPGVWNLTGMLNSADGISAAFPIIEYTDDNSTWMYQQLEVNVGTHIVSVLDKIEQTLYLYSLVDNNWVAYYSDNDCLGIPLLYAGDSINTAGLGSLVNNDDVFIFASPNVSGDEGFQQGYYWLYRFDITQPTSNAWQAITQQPWTQFALPGDSVSYAQGFLIAPTTTGVYLVQGLIYDHASVSPEYYFILPFMVTWNIPTSDTSTWQVNFQKIFSPNILDPNNSLWGFNIQNTSFAQPTRYGSLMTSNLLNIIAAGYPSYPSTRYLTRYAGGGTYDGINAGWVGDRHFTVLGDDSDQWCQMATMDTTVAINGSGDTYNYFFYQYSPYGNSTDSNHPYWFSQTNVATAMGENTDWEAIMATVNEVLMLVGVFFECISFWLFFPGIAVAEGLAAMSTLLKWAVRAYELADFTVNNVAGLAAQFILAPMAKNALAGRNEGSDIGMKYLMVGQGNVMADPENLTPPTAFAKVWDSVNQCWTWQTIGNFDISTVNNNASGSVPWQNSDYESGIYTFLGQDLYSYGNSFIPFSYVAFGYSGKAYEYFRGFYLDQVAFFQNGQCLAIDLMPKFEAGPFPSQDHIYPANSFCYIFYNHVAEGQPSPVMCTAWGGILGYQPLINVYANEDVFNYDFAWESNSTAFSNNFVGPSNVQPSLATAKGLLLTMARDGLLEGPITDYVVDQVVSDDGYQTYNTFFQYMPNNAIYQAIESVVYNQVRVASGGVDYPSSAIANGWSEYYFYNGGFNYYQQIQPAGTNPLPYDPSGSSDTFSSVNQNQTNTSLYFSLVTGKMYCQRTLRSQDGSSDFSEGYEVSRQQTFYHCFENYLTYDSNNTPTTQQKVTGALPVLTVSYIAPSNTTTVDITDAYAAGSATLNTTYYFYDIAYIDIQGNAQTLYGPLNPGDSSISYQLGLNSGLKLGQLTFNYHQTAIQCPLVIEGYYTQILPGIGVSQQNNQACYQQFTNLNLCNTTVQTTTWYHPNIVPATSGSTLLAFALPSSAWGSSNTIDWQIIAATTNTWQTFTDKQNNPLSWYPTSHYSWQGNSDGSAQTESWDADPANAFPWTAPPVNAANTVWLQQGSAATTVTASGIVLATATNTDVPSYTQYDQNLRWPVANVTNAGSFGESAAFYTAFEAYEDLSNWFTTVAGENVPLMFSFYSYAGNRSLEFLAVANTSYTLSVNLPSVTLSQNQWLLAMTVLVPAGSTSANLTIQVAANAAGQPNQGINLYQQTVTSATSWVNYCLPLDFSEVTTPLTDLTVVFNPDIATSIYIDNIYLVPAQNTQFSFPTYDLATLSRLACASPQDPTFCTRQLYAYNGRAIGLVRKATQSASDPQWLGNPLVAAQIHLNSTYFSRNGENNNDHFSATDPNASLQIAAGSNQPIAGYYFDFCDGLNPWTGGSVAANARSLLLDVNQQATYPIPNNLNWGIGIRAQIQGYIQLVASVSLSANESVATPQALALPTPIISDCFHVYGVYNNNSGSVTDLYAFDIVFDPLLASGINPLNQASTLALSNSTPVLNNQQLLTCHSPGDLLFGAFKTNGQYSIYNFAESSPIEIVTSNTALFYPPLAASNNIVYYADEATGLYAVDVSNCVNQPNLGFNPTVVVSYNDIIAAATCPLPPSMDVHQKNIVWFLNSNFPGAASSQALQFNANQNGFAQVVDAANVMNFNYNEDFTIECWLKCGQLAEGALNYAIARWNTTAGAQNSYPYLIRIDSNGYVYGVRYDIAQNNPSVMSSSTIFDSNFHHIAFVRQTDATGQGHLLLYIDGQLEGSGIDNTTVSTQSDAPLSLNAVFYQSEQSAGNEIMELRIWNYARSAKQIDVNRMRQLTGYEGGLVGYWPCNGNPEDLSYYKQDLALSSCQYVNLPNSNSLPAPTSAWVKYDTTLNRISAWVISSGNDALPNITIPPTVSMDGTVFVASANNVYAYDTQLAFINGATINGTIAGQITAGNGRVFVVTTTGTLYIYDESLNLIMSAATGMTVNSAPVLHGNKVSVVGQLDNVWSIYTYNIAGKLVTQPYTLTNVQETVNIQAFSAYLPSLCVMIDNTTFMRLDFGVPLGTRMSLGDYTVLYTQDSDTLNYQYQLQYNGVSVESPINVAALNTAQGDWWLMVVGNILYFYADSELIFAYTLANTTLPTGNFTLSTGSNAGISCRDIIIMTDPIVNNQFIDGGGRLRQTQTLATVN